LRGGAYDWLVGDVDLTDQQDAYQFLRSGRLLASGDVEPAEVRAAPVDADLTAFDGTSVAPPIEPAPEVEDPDLTADFGGEVESDLGAAPQAETPSDDIDPVLILRDRPDVYASFYAEFYGPNNDRHSSAWADRVGGETPEDYARYWYETHGRTEGYTPESGGGAAPGEGSADTPQGRTTIDGVPLSKILQDRPDVFQAFFTEYYGPNNDRHSDAWVERVGGATVEDFANYWYNAHGKLEGYRPSTASAPEPTPDPAPPTDAASASEPPVADPSLDPWNHPAIYPDWQPPYAGWAPPAAGSTGSDEDGSLPVVPAAPSHPQDPFVYSDPGSPMLPILPGQSLLGASDPMG